MIYWFTGQPGAGKTTLAVALKEKLVDAIHIDGDDLRKIYDNVDYSEQGRRNNIELAQHLAYFLHNKGFDVVVSLVSPYLDQREAFKEKLGNSIKEFYIHTTDIRGREKFHVNNYETPTTNFFDIDTSNILLSNSLKKIIDYAELG